MQLGRRGGAPTRIGFPTGRANSLTANPLDTDEDLGAVLDARDRGRAVPSTVQVPVGDRLKLVKKRAECLLSCHDLMKTPSLDEMREIVKRQREAGADICKIITTAQAFEDNLTVLKLIGESPGVRLISFAMGPMGTLSRILCPLAGGELTYASIEKGKESAPGQITVNELTGIYEMIFRNPSP